MILEHYNLKAQPFGVTPNPAFLYFSHTHREAMASLMLGVLSQRGFTALVGSPGMGKTSLLFNLLEKLKGSASTAFLFQTLCGPQELLHALLSDLGLPNVGADMAQMHATLNQYLLQEARRGRQVVLIIDEAQNLNGDTLELVRMLSNFETSEKKLMHVVLTGQPQFAEKLATDNLVQLRQRISILARLTPLNADETRQYIDHRLRVAGFPARRQLFTEQAYDVVAEYSRGVPRQINNLCFNSMLLGCAVQRKTLDALIVREAIDDLNLERITRSSQASLEPLDQAHIEVRTVPAANGSQTPLLSSTAVRRNAAKFWKGKLATLAMLVVLSGLIGPAYRAVAYAKRQFNVERPLAAVGLNTTASAERSKRDAVPGNTHGSEEVKSRGEPSAAIEVRVRPHESLFSICKANMGRFDRRVLAEILKLNPWLTHPEQIQPGQIIRIPSNQQGVRQVQVNNTVPVAVEGKGTNP